MEKERVKNHIKLSIVVIIIGWILSSYVFGSFNHDGVSPINKIRTLIAIGFFVAIANYGYSEIFYKKEDKER